MGFDPFRSVRSSGVSSIGTPRHLDLNAQGNTPVAPNWLAACPLPCLFAMQSWPHGAAERLASHVFPHKNTANDFIEAERKRWRAQHSAGKTNSCAQA
jgi:hypothetical protein